MTSRKFFWIVFIIIIVGAIFWLVKINFTTVKDKLTTADKITQNIPQLLQNAIVAPLRSEKVKVKLFFASVDNVDCQADQFKEVEIDNTLDDLGLIPKITNLLLAESSATSTPGLFSSLPVGAQLLSFGYEDGRVSVDFSPEMNTGGGSCAMGLRRNQIEKTLLGLNEVTSLNIKTVEIKVDGETETALQP